MIKNDKKYKKDTVPLFKTITFSTHWGTMTQTRTYDTFVLFEPYNKPLMPPTSSMLASIPMETFSITSGWKKAYHVRVHIFRPIWHQKWSFTTHMQTSTFSLVLSVPTLGVGGHGVQKHKNLKYAGSNFLRAKTFQTKHAKPFLTTNLKNAGLLLRHCQRMREIRNHLGKSWQFWNLPGKLEIIRESRTVLRTTGK